MKFLLLFLSLFLWPVVTSAHFLETSGDIGAVLHVDPDDDPVAGQPASFYFDIKQRMSSFDTSNCACIVTITQNGTTLFSQSLGTDQSPPVTYTLPQKAVYGLSLVGKPITGSSFQPFTLHWDIRVDRAIGSGSATHTQPTWLRWLLEHGLHLLPILAASGYVVYRTATDKR